MEFFHRVAGAKFFLPDGKEVSFAGGKLDTATIQDEVSRAVLEKELGRIANVPASMIYTKAPIKDIAETAVAGEVNASATSHFDQVHKTPAGAVTTPMPMAETTHSPVASVMHAEPQVPANNAAAMQAKMDAARAAVAAHAAKPAVAPVHKP